MAQTHRQKGFSAVEAVVVVLILAVLAGGGWFVWHKHNGMRSVVTVTKSSSSVSNTDKQGQQPVNTVDDQYLAISEWGVRITLPGSLRGDISYFVDDKAKIDLGGPEKIDLVSKRFSAGSLKCAVVEGDTPRTLVSFYRETPADGVVTQDPSPFKTLNGVRYYFVETPCEEAINRSGSAQDKQLLSDLKDAVANTLENY
ncbi:MAG TPA: prepilin-type N-terminal cleavage/methylation domain-containing protein [Candidatus Saccharimonadales bacterium]|nr:prepilin-type N-terminal cleavage/methylation domain-containing protein [Candidatus Saccharimonadales bacterium]